MRLREERKPIGKVARRDRATKIAELERNWHAHQSRIFQSTRAVLYSSFYSSSQQSF